MGPHGCPSARRILDLGSGIGTVAMVAAWRLPGAEIVTIEAQEESTPLAKKSVRWNGFEDRFDIRQGDLRSPDVLTKEEKFDLILGSPPYFPLGTGVVGDHPQKVACRFEVRGTIADYCSTASQHLENGGIFACVFPVNPDEQRERVTEASKAADLTIVRERHIVLREGEPPLLGPVCHVEKMRPPGVHARSNLGRASAGDTRKGRHDSPGIFCGEVELRLSTLNAHRSTPALFLDSRLPCFHHRKECGILESQHPSS